jgi:hypothetical protein
VANFALGAARHRARLDRQAHFRGAIEVGHATG